MSNRDIAEGSLVFLKVDHEWDRGNDNPLTCTGTASEEEGVIGVRWDNGSYNTYGLDDDDLIPISYQTRTQARSACAKNPNFTVAKIESPAGNQWVLVLKQRLVVNDLGNAIV